MSKAKDLLKLAEGTELRELGHVMAGKTASFSCSECGYSNVGPSDAETIMCPMCQSVMNPVTESDNKVSEQMDEYDKQNTLNVLLDYLNSKTGQDYKVVQSQFDFQNFDFSVVVSPTVPESPGMVDDLASIFGTEVGNVSVIKDTVKVNGAGSKMEKE
jgi:uncharacterized Zn finger protein (UPF0148 family)